MAGGRRRGERIKSTVRGPGFAMTPGTASRCTGRRSRNDTTVPGGCHLRIAPSRDPGKFGYDHRAVLR